MQDLIRHGLLAVLETLDAQLLALSTHPLKGINNKFRLSLEGL